MSLLFYRLSIAILLEMHKTRVGSKLIIGAFSWPSFVILLIRIRLLYFISVGTAIPGVVLQNAINRANPIFPSDFLTLRVCAPVV